MQAAPTARSRRTWPRWRVCWRRGPVLSIPRGSPWLWRTRVDTHKNRKSFMDKTWTISYDHDSPCYIPVLFQKIYIPVQKLLIAMLTAVNQSLGCYFGSREWMQSLFIFGQFSYDLETTFMSRKGCQPLISASCSWLASGLKFSLYSDIFFGLKL